MNIDKISATNQQFTCLNLHLKQLLLLNETASAEHLVALKKAYSQSLCFHFSLFYKAFLQEIAADYRIDITLDKTFTDLNEALEKVGIVSAQCQVLVDLECDKSSWLSVALSRYQDCLTLSFVSRSAYKNAGNLIALTDLSTSNLESEIENAANRLKELVEQYRQLMQEW